MLVSHTGAFHVTHPRRSGGIALPISALAAPITVHNTGVDGTDALVAAGAPTTFWTLLSAPVGAAEALGSDPFRYFNGAYVGDSLVSAWVSPNASGAASVGGIYVYELIVDLSAFDVTTVSIGGLFSTDNDGFMRLNGGPDAATTGFADFGSLHPFALSGFLPGFNSIQIGVNNGGNPTAFRVEFTEATGTPLETTAVPEPASLLLVGSGIAGMIARRRRQKQQVN